jgi:hypothetical protein
VQNSKCKTQSAKIIKIPSARFLRPDSLYREEGWMPKSQTCSGEADGVGYPDISRIKNFSPLNSQKTPKKRKIHPDKKHRDAKSTKVKMQN